MKIDAAFAFRLLEGAKKRGADLAEVYLKSSKNLLVEVRDRELDAVESSHDFGYALRVIKNRRLGFSFSTDAEDAASVMERAVEASQWTEQDECLDLPEPAEHKPLNIFDSAVASLSEDEAVEKALGIEEAALAYDGRIKKVRKAGLSCSSGTVLIMNSKGLEKTYSATSCTAQITVVAKEKDDSRMGWDFDGARFLKDIDFRDVGKRAAERGVSLLGSQRMNAVRADIILDNSVAAEFLGIFASLLSSEAVQKGKSLLAGKVGKKVVNPIVGIVDDGLIERRLGSRPFDAEGIPTFRKHLIEEGVLLGYMYNVYTSKKDKVISTGNAARTGFSSLPAVGPSIFSITSSVTLGREGLLAVPERCLYITEAMGIHMANPVSGEFSIGVSGLWTENGEKKYPVREAVISGNILDLFGKVRAAGDDLRFYGNMGSPSLLVESVDISA
jgi:PmbA protein